MPLLKDIPKDTLNPEEVELIANKEFDYADRERVSIREARKRIRTDLVDRITAENIREINRVFGENFEVPDLNFDFGNLTEGHGEFTFREKAVELAKTFHREGLGSIVKLPGVALKAIGESAPNRKEIAEFKQSPYTFNQLRAKYFESSVGKKQRAGIDMLRRAGNKYIDFINGMTTDESPESRIARQGSFMAAPIFRTLSTIGGSAPSYGLAVVAALTSGNPNIGLYVIGATATSTAYESLRQQNVDPDLALIGAVLEGTIEMVTEKVPMDILMKGGGRPFLVRALRLGTAESFQELLAQLGQNYVEAVVKDVDPDNYATVLQAARQEWSVISDGWQDAMAAGFFMGGGAAAFSPGIDLGRTPQEMMTEYGVSPRNTNELLFMVEQIRQKARDVSKPVEEAKEEAPQAVTGEGEVITKQRRIVTQTAIDKIEQEIVDAELSQDRKEIKRLEIQKDKLFKQNANDNVSKLAGKESVTVKLETPTGSTIAIVFPSSRKSGKWQVSIIDNVDNIPLGHGTFDTQEDAVRAVSGDKSIEGHSISRGQEFLFVESQAPTPTGVTGEEKIGDDFEDFFDFEETEAEPEVAVRPAEEADVGDQEFALTETGMTNAKRNGQIRRFRKLVREHPVFKQALEGQEDQPDLSGIFNVDSQEIGDIRQRFEGKPNILKKFKLQETGGRRWDTRADELGIEGGLDDFMDAVELFVESKGKEGVFNQAALQVLEKSGQQDAELTLDILDLLEAGESPQEINSQIRQFAEQNKLEESDVNEFFIPELTDEQIESELETARKKDEKAAGLETEKLEAKEKLRGVEQQRLKAIEAEQKTREAAREKKILDRLTPEERIELEELEQKFINKIRNQLNVGLDPETFILATKIGTFYVKAGIRSFQEWAAQVRQRVGNLPDFTLRTVYSALRQKFPDLDSDADIDKILEIGSGEQLPRGTSVSVMAQAIEDEIVEENKAIYDEIPMYRAMNMSEQAQKALRLIEEDLGRAKRIAFYQEPAPPDLFPENVFSALRTYAKLNADVDLIMDLALNEDVVREHTIMGKRIKSLDTDMDYADPIRAIREVVESRKEQMIRQGKDISALEVKLRELQTELDNAQKAKTEFTKRAARTYGTRNKVVTRTEYDKIIARRKEEAAQLRHDPRLGAAYVPNAQDFSDLAKISIFHLEALGRDFAKWSHQVTVDLGKWVTPHLQDAYDRALLQAKKEGIEVKESKRLSSKKKRLVTVTGKIEAKFDDLDLTKTARIPIELDEEGKRLQEAYNLAREKMKAAQAVANIITEKEVQIIAQLAKDAAERKQKMEKSERRKEGVGATKTELEYGTSLSMFLEYVSDLKVEANQRTMGQVLKDYLRNPVDFVSDFAGTLKAAKASLDNSFIGRQGLRTFLKGITGDVKSAKIWADTFVKSWRVMWNTLRKRKVMRGLFAEMVSDPDYDLLKKSKVALNVIEEEIPVDIPSRIPLIGILFRMGENAFVWSSRYMRYQLAKQYIGIWRKSGKELNKRELESIGKLANSQTGRGDSAAKSQKPGLLNNLFWSPRNLRAHVDILTLHLFDRNFTAFARKQAALNLIRYISGAAMILSIANWIDDDSVTFDPTNANFGKIKIGSTRFSIGGGMEILIILAARLITRKFTSSTTGVTKSIDTKRFGALTGKDLVFNFLENKLSPAAALALSIIDQQSRDGENLVIPQMIDNALTPLIIQNVMETGSSDDSANVLAALIAEALGINVQTYDGKKEKSNIRTRL